MFRHLPKYEHFNSKVRSSQSQLGFTLIELVVVISIITLMMAITLPVVSNIRKSVRGTLCLARMRGLAFATSMYRQDHNRRFPQPTENTNLLASKGGKYDDHTVASALWFNAVDPYLGLKPRQYHTWWGDDPANRNYSKLKQDPVWEAFDSDNQKGNRTIKMSNYFKNDKKLGFSYVRTPGRTLLYVDARAQDIVDAGSHYCAAFSATAGVVALRHKDGANVAFADGHASLVHQKIRYDLAAPCWFTPSALPGQKIVWNVDK